MKDSIEIQLSNEGLLRSSIPTYFLDINFYFVDWNVPFEVLMANPLGLKKADHITEFVKYFESEKEVKQRAAKVFNLSTLPKVDIEKISIVNPKYGQMEFQKIATQVFDEKGDQIAWGVQLNLLKADKEKLLWEDLKEGLEQQ